GGFAGRAGGARRRGGGADGARRFYTGEIAASLVAAVRAAGGDLDAADFDAHTSTWEEPLFGSFRGVRVAEMPPSTQGVTALQALALLDCLGPLDDDPMDPARSPLSVESVRRAMAARNCGFGAPVSPPAAAPRPLEPGPPAALRAAIPRTPPAPATAPSIPPR